MPHTHTITHTTYNFDELSPKSQDKALENISILLYENIDTNSITEVFKYTLENEYGLKLETHDPTDSIFWHLNYCQGDGVAFYGSLDIDFMLQHPALTHIHKELKIIAEHEYFFTNISIFRGNPHYDHWNTMKVTVETDCDGDEQFGNAVQTVKESLQQYVKEVSKQLEEMGYKMLENQYNVKACKEFINDNKLEFYEDGILWE